MFPLNEKAELPFSFFCHRIREFGTISMNILQVQYLRKLQEAVLYFCTIEECQSYNSWKSGKLERCKHLKCDFIIITSTNSRLCNRHEMNAVFSQIVPLLI